MYHINDTLVRTRHRAQQAEILQEREKRDLVRYTAGGSSSLPGQAVGRLGDGLIRLGHKLKDRDNSKSSSLDLTFDCD